MVNLNKTLKPFVPPAIWEYAKRSKNELISLVNKERRNERKEAKANLNEEKRLKKLERYVKTETNFLGHKLRIVDNASFGFIRKELFELEIYKFTCTSANPHIIDCGANIGLSIIYFKRLYPSATIIGFEPDKKVFDVLKYNIESFDLPNVQLIERACWNEETILKFYSEGADAGRVAAETNRNGLIEIKTVRLRNYLNQRVDFLKIDIEGAETRVLEDCADLLHNVDKLFVEYHSIVGEKQTLGSLLQILTNAGFRYQVQHIGVFSSHPFIKVLHYNNMDLQLNIFAYK